MLTNKSDEEAMKLFGELNRADLTQKEIENLVEESGGCIVTAIMKAYNAGFVRGYKRKDAQ